MRLAIVASAHGFGHATRDVALADELAARGHEITLFTAAPASVIGRAHAIFPRRVDVGLVQPDSLRQDLDATRVALDTCCSNAAINAMSRTFALFDGVIADIAPTALEAARLAGVPAVAMGNFDWAWIYRHYAPLADHAARFADWQAPHPAVQLRPGPDLTGFARTTEGGLLARRFAPQRARHPAPVHILVGFGGFGLDHLESLLPELPGVAWILAPPMARTGRVDCWFEADIPFSALLAGADVVLTKPGYGMLAEATLAGVPVLWLDRGDFPEAPFLEAALFARGDQKVAANPGSDPPGRVRVAIEEALGARLAALRPPPRLHDNRAGIADALLVCLG
ncbi:hypothetical protein LBMAG42_43620 [Deltaproteobacteria bacterium]|nr:hypothetical protein LBMAG42_43620 [Deltaproteobacteria bacterium]